MFAVGRLVLVAVFAEKMVGLFGVETKAAGCASLAATRNPDRYALATLICVSAGVTLTVTAWPSVSSTSNGTLTDM